MSDLIESFNGQYGYIGIWTNWSKGAVGLTLTLSHKHGAFLTSFLTLLITFTGTCFWKIACFTSHYSLSEESPQDGIYHLLLLSLLVTGVFTPGSILSSQIANSMGKEILPRTPFCGFFSSSMSEINHRSVLNSHTTQLITWNLNYADRCYRKHASADCKLFVIPSASLYH
jgi:hypothetical protein